MTPAPWLQHALRTRKSSAQSRPNSVLCQGPVATSANLILRNAGWTLNDASQAGDFALQAHEVAANVMEFTRVTRILQDSDGLFRGI
jgi:hypothetical protein